MNWVSRAWAINVAALLIILLSLPSSGEEKSHKKVDFKPPKDAITTQVVEVASGVDESVRLRIERLQPAKERTLAIPLKNRSSEDLKIKNVKVSCGCMAAIASDLAIDAKSTATIYLRVTPEETGPFAKRATIEFERGNSVVVAIESRVVPAYSITPYRVPLIPGSEKGVKVTVTSNFGAAPFSVECSDPMISLRKVKLSGSTMTLECKMLKDGANLPWESNIPITVQAGDGRRTYQMGIINAATIKVKPHLIVVDKRRDEHTARAVITGFDINEKPLICRIEEAGKSVNVSVSRRRDLGSMVAIYELLIEGEVDQLATVELDWIDKTTKKVVSTSKLVFRP